MIQTGFSVWCLGTPPPGRSLAQATFSAARFLNENPLFSRILFTVSAIGLFIGSHIADYLSVSHIFNDRWPPHAKFHTGQTLAMSFCLAVFTVAFAWRKTSDLRGGILAAAGFASVYWITQAAAIIYPGTAFIDPEFLTPGFYHFGLSPQAFVEIVFMAVIVFASWWALRRVPIGK